MKGDRLRIGEVARQAGVNIQTLRYYERRRLLEKPKRAASGYREYTPATVPFIRFIKRAQHLGFTLNEVKDLIALRDAKDGGRSEVRALAEARMRDIDLKLAQLQAMRAALQGLVESCACHVDGPICPIIEALDDGRDASKGVDPSRPRRHTRVDRRSVHAGPLSGRGEVKC